MTESHFLAELLLALAIAAVGVALFERVRLPPIAGFLLMGALLGPGGLALAPRSAEVRRLAEFGVVFLLFEIGLELPFEALRRRWRTTVAAGGLQVALTIGAVSVGAIALGLRPASAVVMGGLVAMSSTALVMRLLSEAGEADAPHGQLSFGVLIFQDLCIVPLLVALPMLSGAVPPQPGAIALALGKAAAALSVLFVATGYAVPWALDRLVRVRSRELFSLIAFLLAVGSAVGAEEMGLTLAVGAFSAGVMLGSSPYAHQLTAELVPLRGVLLGVFFTAVGMLFDARAAAHLWPAVLLYVVAVVPLKAAIVFSVVTVALRGSPRVATLTGLALAQTGEFSFVLSNRASAAGLLDAGLQQVFVTGSIASLVATPFLIQLAPWLTRWVGGPALATTRSARAHAPAREAPRVVLIGFGLTGRTIAGVLRAAKIPYSAVDANPQNVQRAQRRGESVVYGDATHPTLLRRLGVEDARVVAIAISDPLATRGVVSHLHDLAPQAQIIARTRYVADSDELYGAGASAVVAEEFEATLDMMSAVGRAAGVPDGALARVADQLREEGYEALRAPATLLADPWFADLLAEVSSEWVSVPEGPEAGHSIGELAVRTRTGASILAVESAEGTQVNPAPERELAAGDRVLAIGSTEALAKLRALLGGAP
ncbi:MAG TPA: cation:proton antiporter [Myxococcota bacterium]|nr:cation:proton antiporter [Myxococcota bacterium]